MFDYLKGLLTYKNSCEKGYSVTVEVNGVGYSLEVTERDYRTLNIDNEAVKLYVSLIHKEDKMSLCGFLKREDRDMFLVLTSVSGVGQKMALALLNSYSTSNIISFVLNEDYRSLTSAKGVGQKLAQKIIIDLKGKLNSYKNDNICENISAINNFDNNNIKDAQMVLLSLGYENKEINTALENALNSLKPSSSVEDILKKTLQLLSV